MSSVPPPTATSTPTAVPEPEPQPTGPAEGWYPDPQGPGLRWWDGMQWTTHVQDPAAEHAAKSQASASAVPATTGSAKPAKAKGEGFSLARWVEENQVLAVLLAILVVAAVGAIATFV